MRRTRNVAWGCLVVLLTVVSCNSKGTQPNDGGPNLLSNGSFEDKGNPSLAGWKLIDSALISLKPEAPPMGGSYCLSMGAGWIPERCYAWAQVPGVQAGDILVVSATGREWQGGMLRGGLGLIVGPSSRLPRNFVRDGLSFPVSSWSSVSMVDTVFPGPSDTVWVVLYGPTCELCQDAPTRFDLVSVRRLID